ncbi:MAG: hypothetical protein AAGK14_01640 [Verrucomicrobiota bacterium]
MSQSNTKSGDLVFAAGEDLTNKEGHLVKLTHDSGTPEVKLPEAITDRALYAVVSGGADTENVQLRPLSGERNVRVVLLGTCNPGDALVLADPATAADAGKLRVLPTAAGTYHVLAIAEEAGADGQLLAIRPYAPGEVEVSA